MGRAPRLEPTLGSLSVVGTLQPPWPVSRALCPNIRGPSPGARPSWETWHVGGFLPTLPTGHSESTQELGPLHEPKEAEARAQGGRAVQIGLEPWASLGLGSRHYIYCPGWIQVLPAQSCSCLRTCAPQKLEQVVFSSVGDGGASIVTPPRSPALADHRSCTMASTHWPCGEGPSSAESAAGGQHNQLNPQPHSEYSARRTRREPDAKVGALSNLKGALNPAGPSSEHGAKGLQGSRLSNCHEPCPAQPCLGKANWSLGRHFQKMKDLAPS